MPLKNTIAKQNIALRNQNLFENPVDQQDKMMNDIQFLFKGISEINRLYIHPQVITGS